MILFVELGYDVFHGYLLQGELWKLYVLFTFAMPYFINIVYKWSINCMPGVTWTIIYDWAW